MNRAVHTFLQRQAPRLWNNARTFVNATPVLLETKTIAVPSMGDSITEGTIVEWTVQVGQAVQEDDVVCLIETDKVTVDIKAVMAGVVTQQFGAIDDTVEVGANLYEIDPDASATLASSDDSTPPTPAVEAVEKKESPPPAAPSSSESVPPAPAATSSHREPSIHFLGKNGWSRRLSPQAEPVSLIPDKPNGVVVLDGSMLTATYGRPRFSEEEMEALITGGASMAPKVVSQSKGAKFSAK